MVTFSADRATFRRRDDDISTQLDIAVSTEDDVEVRRLTVRNHGARIREIDVTSYAEIVLTPAATISRIRRSASCSSRPSTSPTAPRCSATAGRAIRRARGLGVSRAEPRGPAAGAGRVGNRSRALPRPRPRPRRDPEALDGRALSGTTGHRARSDRQPAPAHPAAARRHRAALRSPPAWRPIARPPRRWRGSTTTRARRRAPSRWRCTHAQSALRHLGISADEALLFERLASRVLGTDGSLRASAETIAANELGQPGLWPHAHLGRPADPARAGRRRRRRRRWCGRCCRRRSTGGSRG